MRIIKTFIRVYVTELDSALSFYEDLLGTKAEMRFAYPQVNLELASVGDILLIAGCEENLKTFQDTKGTFLVDSVEEFKHHLQSSGAKIVRGPNDVATGKNMTVKHPDGTIFEYVQHFKAIS